MGAGALGSVLGAILSRKNDVLLITRGQHLKAIQESGLQVDGLIKGTFNLEATDTYPGGAELIIFTVKAYQTEEAKKLIYSEYSDEPIITFQNGIGMVNMLKDLNLIPGSTSIGATYLSPGSVAYTGAGDTYIGELSGEISERVKSIASNFTESGLPTVPVKDIMRRRWIKAAVNACINPLTAVLGVKNGELRDRSLMDIVRCVAMECEAMIREQGVETDLLYEVKRVIEKTADNKSSMLQDIEHGKKTEIDYISGPFLAGNCNRTLYNMVKFIEKRL